MIYEYKDRTIVEFTDGSRASYAAKRYGSLLDKIVEQSLELDRKVWNYFQTNGNTTEVFYYEQSSESEVSFLIDSDDLPKVIDYYWTLNTNEYAFTRTGGSTIFLHNLILDFDQREDVTDHINRDRLDNRKVNLRRASHSLNGLNKSTQSNNTSNVTGVDRYRDKWRARIQFKEIKHTRVFDTKEQAIEQRKQWERELAVKFNDYGESQ